ncbi:stage II sporulation protein D [Selenihalanaerobacter shriftii]|nr:stage II sporulation protein D [Selenihalanaerobacter shriftii]
MIKGWDSIIDDKNNQIRVKIIDSNEEVIELPLEEYIKGVVAAEMPANFGIEALKAQAVAARTYTLRKVQGNKSRIIEMTTDINSDQAWIDKEEMMKRWGNLKYWFKIAKAVDSTEGIFLTYEGRIISAVYHSASGGVTAAARNVWGRDLPYLKVVKSPYESNSPYNHYVQEYSIRDFGKRLGINRLNKAELIYNMKILEKSSSGRVLKIQVLDQILTGRELRTRLGLKSTNFRYKLQGSHIKFITKGNGHGAGMSQYGANGMAKKGYNYLEILKHYYPGTKLKRMTY